MVKRAVSANSMKHRGFYGYNYFFPYVKPATEKCVQTSLNLVYKIIYLQEHASIHSVYIPLDNGSRKNFSYSEVSYSYKS